jgi:hypothetical protein
MILLDRCARLGRRLRNADPSMRRTTRVGTRSFLASARGPHGVLLLEGDDLRQPVPDASSDLDEADQPAGNSRVPKSLRRDVPSGGQLLVCQESLVARGRGRFLPAAHDLTVWSAHRAPRPSSAGTSLSSPPQLAVSAGRISLYTKSAVCSFP